MSEEEQRVVNNHLSKITARQRMVLVYCAKGLSCEAAANLLHCSPYTVGNHRMAIQRRLGMTMYQACALAGKAGLV